MHRAVHEWRQRRDDRRGLDRRAALAVASVASLSSSRGRSSRS